MIGLKRGTVELMPHQKEWVENAESTIRLLKEILGDTAVDIQHVGSTAIRSIQAKPIIDLAVGLRELSDILPHEEILRQQGFIFRGEDVPGQMLFVMGDFEKDTRTHHIHAVKWKSREWNHYIAFRDYLNANPEKAKLYDQRKRELALRYGDDRKSYTAGKQEIIDRLLGEAVGTGCAFPASLTEKQTL